MKAHAPRAAARLDAGTAAFRGGDFARAKREFQRAHALYRAQLGADDPSTLRALSDMGAACAALGDHAGSLAAHQAALDGRRRFLGEAHEDVGVSLHNLATAHAALGDETAAIAAHLAAIAIWRASLDETHPIIARPLAALAALARKQADPHAAIDYARQALRIHRDAFPPNHDAIAACLDDLATAQDQAGDTQAAQASWREALSLPGAPQAPLWVKLGISRRRVGDITAAAACFATAVQADGDMAAARHHLAAALTRLGRNVEARPHLAAALTSQHIFAQPSSPEALRVLILASSDEGNIPLEYLLPERDFARIWWFIGHSPDPRAQPLPAHDIVLNAIGDADMTGSTDGKLAAFLDVNTKPLVNDPARVARTRRDLLPVLLDRIEGMVVPRICRIENTPSRAAIMNAAEAAGIAPPLLLRPAGAHGGAGVLRIENRDGPDLPTAPTWYATSFHDCRAPDGYTRKYRVIFVNREPRAYHLAISPDWLVHYFSADMAGHAWKLAEEAAFLADPQAVLGARAWAALNEAGRRLDLEYCGMDFGVAGGDVVVFEANPTMLVHPEPDVGPLAFKNAAVGRIVDAVKQSFCEKKDQETFIR